MSSESVTELYREIRECRECELRQGRELAVPGEGPEHATVMFVGEAPGEKEDRTGLPFQGNAGRVFDKLLGIAGLQREEVYVTGAVKCRPPENRDPKAEEIHACNRYLRRQIELVRPRVIVALGRSGLMAVTGGKEAIANLRGRPLEHNGATLLVTYHPAAAFYRRELKEQLEDDFRLLGQIVKPPEPRWDHPASTGTNADVAPDCKGATWGHRRLGAQTWGHRRIDSLTLKRYT